VKTFTVAMLLAGLVACTGTDDHPDHPPSTVTFEGRDAVLYVEIAKKADEHRKGLMGVETLPDDEGMAFVFDEPSDTPFWMKDTLIPLSIAFVDDAGRVIGVRDMEPCEADPCPTYDIDRPFVLAIEANIGWFERAGIEVGDRAELRMSAYG